MPKIDPPPQLPSKNGALSASLEVLHRFHPYCARFPSKIAIDAIREFTRRSERVYDPFCGSGTSLVAGLALNRKVTGGDIDPLAGLLSRLKCTPLAATDYKDWRLRFGRTLGDAVEDITNHWPPKAQPAPGTLWSVGAQELNLPSMPRLNYWFPPQAIAFFAAVASAARRLRTPHLVDLALATLSATIISKWPNTLSYAKDIDHTRPHREVQSVLARRALKVYLSRLDRTIDSLSRLHEVYAGVGISEKLSRFASVHCPADARGRLPVVTGSQDLVVTSPPYFDAVDYPRAHRMSLCWMNGHASGTTEGTTPYIGLRPLEKFEPAAWLDDHPDVRRHVPMVLREANAGRRLVLFFSDLDRTLKHMWRALKPGGHMVAVIAANKVSGHHIPSHQAFASLAYEVGFRHVDTRTRAIKKARRRFPVGAFGFDGPMTHEHVIVAVKPRATKA